MSTARDVRELIDERPELEPAVEAVLDADEPFTFDDLGIDSGSFGEIVAAGVAEQTDDGYTVTDREAVRRGLSGDIESETDEADRDLSLPTIEYRIVAAVGGAVLLVVAMRLVSWPSVFRGGDIVLSGNDPYFYRYWVEQLLLNPETSIATLPGAVTRGEPLFILTLWAGTVLLGGTKAIAGQVMAWYPIVSAAVTAVLLYLLAVEVTEDRRVGLAAVTLLAINPGHALRTSLGFADHHAFDYPWLVLTALSLVILADADLRSRRTILGILGLSVGVVGQTLAWDASPLLLVPIGLAFTLWSATALYQGDGPLDTVGPALAGVGLGAAVVWGAHSSLGWHANTVAGAPLLIFFGGVGVVGLAELADRFGISPQATLMGDIIIALGGGAVLVFLLPDVWTRLTSEISSRLVREGAIAETQNLFGQSVGWLLLFGFLLALMVPYLAWATRRALEDTRWTTPAVYGWYLLLLAVIQIRFVGELAAFNALFAGLGFVHLAGWVDLSRPPVPFDPSVDGRTLPLPSRRQLGGFLALFLLVGGLAIVQVPVVINQITTPEDRYETAVWMDSYADEQGLEYPQNYVLSQWSYNRVFNYFVSGESRSYDFAQQQYAPFLSSNDAEGWYERLRDRAGFVVYEPRFNTSGRSIGGRMAAFGSRGDNAPGLAHYRAVYVSDGDQYRVFTLVPGATITGNAGSNTTVEVSSDVSIDGATFTYERRVRTGRDGTYSVTVPYPGEYAVGNDTVTVPTSAVEAGQNVSV